MGVDIHMYLISKEGELIKDKLFKGRNSEWFDNLSKRGTDPAYLYLDSKQGLPENIPDIIKEESKWCYGYRYVTLNDYFYWYQTHKPYLKAGWVRTYDKWACEAKNIMPEDEDVYQEKPKGDDWEFLEYNDIYCPDSKIYKSLFCTIIDPKKWEDYYLVWYFDC